MYEFEYNLIEIETLANSIIDWNNSVISIERALVPEKGSIPDHMRHINLSAKLCWVMSIGPSDKKIFAYGNTLQECEDLIRKELWKLIEG
jgi:hypothetical protein